MAQRCSEAIAYSKLLIHSMQYCRTLEFISFAAATVSDQLRAVTVCVVPGLKFSVGI